MSARATLRDAVGGGFRLTPLKPIGLRLRNQLKPWLIRQPRRPMSYRLHADDGRDFKLLRFSRFDAGRHARTQSVLGSLADVEAVPDLIWSGPRLLLVEWIEGREPEAGDPLFAERLGETLAALHRVGARDAAPAEVLAPAREHLEELTRGGRLRAEIAEALSARLDACFDGPVPLGMVCADPTLANFLIDADASLHLIDPGSLQPGLPVDLFLVGGPLWDAIDRERFRAAYRGAGGDARLFALADGLRLLHDLRKCALDARLIATTSPLEAKRRRGRERALAGRLAELRARV